MNGLTVSLSDGVVFNKLSDGHLSLYGYEDGAERDKDFIALQLLYEKLHGYAARQVDAMVLIGKTLTEIRDRRLYRSCSIISGDMEVGYYRFDDFCKNVLHISRTQAQNAINLYEKFTVAGECVIIKEEYKDYRLSQLIEMASIPEEERGRITSDMTVKEIREIKKELKQPQGTALQGQICISDIVAEQNSPTSDCFEKREAGLSDDEIKEILGNFLHGSYSLEITKICKSDKEPWQQAADLSAFFRKYGSAGYATDTCKITLSKGSRLKGDYRERFVSWVSAIEIYKDLIGKAEAENEQNSPTSDCFEKAEEFFEEPEKGSEQGEELEESEAIAAPEEQTENSPTSDYSQEKLNYDLSHFQHVGVRISNDNKKKLDELAAYMEIDRRAILSYALQEYIESMFFENSLNKEEAAIEKEYLIDPFLNSDKCPNLYKKGG